MEGNLVSRRKRLKAQVPDIKSSLAMVKKLREKKSAAESMETQFMLSDQVRAEKQITSPPSSFCPIFVGLCRGDNSPNRQGLLVARS